MELELISDLSIPDQKICYLRIVFPLPAVEFSSAQSRFYGILTNTMQPEKRVLTGLPLPEL